MVIDISLPDLFKLALQVLALLSEALDLKFELKAALLSLSYEMFTRSDFTVHGLNLIGLLVVLDFILAQSLPKLGNLSGHLGALRFFLLGGLVNFSLAFLLCCG